MQAQMRCPDALGAFAVNPRLPTEQFCFRGLHKSPFRAETRDLSPADVWMSKASYPTAQLSKAVYEELSCCSPRATHYNLDVRTVDAQTPQDTGSQQVSLLDHVACFSKAAS